MQLSEMLSDKLKISNGDVNTSDTGKSKVDSVYSKSPFEKYIQSRKDLKNVDKVKNGRIPSLRDELLANGFGKPLK